MTIGKCIFTENWEERDYTSHILEFDLAESYFTTVKWKGRKNKDLFLFFWLALRIHMVSVLYLDYMLQYIKLVAFKLFGHSPQ